MKKERDIFSAVKDRDAAAVKRLIEAGTDPNARDKWGWTTPLHEACLYLEPDIVKLLLEHGANPGARDDRGYTPLHVACRNGYTEIARLLLDHRADPNARDQYGYTPLHTACANGHTDLFRPLLEAGADVNVRNKWDRPPLDSVLNLPYDDPHREEILDLFRQYAPDVVMEAWCTQDPGGMR